MDSRSIAAQLRDDYAAGEHSHSREQLSVAEAARAEIRRPGTHRWYLLELPRRPGVSNGPEVDSQSAGRSVRASASPASGLRVLPLVRAERLHQSSRRTYQVQQLPQRWTDGLRPGPRRGSQRVERERGSGSFSRDRAPDRSWKSRAEPL